MSNEEEMKSAEDELVRKTLMVMLRLMESAKGDKTTIQFKDRKIVFERIA